MASKRKTDAAAPIVAADGVSHIALYAPRVGG
jgi:hypothetical protein